MRFEIDPTPEESLRACHVIASATLPPSRAGMISVGVYLLVGAAAYVLAPNAWGITVMLAALGVMAAVGALQLDGRRRARRALADDPHATERHYIELTEEGIRAWCAHVDTHITWDAITRVVETPEFYVFVRGFGGGPAIPKRVLGDREHHAVRALVRRCAPDRGASLLPDAGTPSGTPAAAR